MLYSYTVSQYVRWLIYTLGFGLAPIVLRWLMVPSHPEQELPYFVLSDFIFFGLMLNAAAMSNLTAQKSRLELFFRYGSATGILSFFLVTIYCATISQPAGYAYWIGVISILVIAGVLSFFSTSDATMEYLQKEIEFIDNLAKLPKDERNAIIETICRISDAKKPDDHELLREATAREVALREQATKK